MTKDIFAIGTALTLSVLLLACNDRQLALGATIGRSVGQSIVSINKSQARAEDRYYQHRYDTYYRYRQYHYQRNYQNSYTNTDHQSLLAQYEQRVVALPDVTQNSKRPLKLNAEEIQVVSNFFKIPYPVAQMILDGKKRFQKGDLRGVMALGFSKEDLITVARNLDLPEASLRRLSDNLGISQPHILDILEDLCAEFKALKATGRLRI